MCFWEKCENLVWGLNVQNKHVQIIIWITGYAQENSTRIELLR